MLLFISGAGKAATIAHSYLRIILDKCHNLLLFQQLAPTEQALFRI